jgi:hypothetical protein
MRGLTRAVELIARCRSFGELLSVCQANGPVWRSRFSHAELQVIWRHALGKLRKVERGRRAA